MSGLRRWVRGVIVLAVMAGGDAFGVAPLPAKQLVGYGWEFPAVSTEEIYQQRADFAETGLDGIILCVDGKRNGKPIKTQWLFNCPALTDADFVEARRILPAITACKGLRTSYALVLGTPTKRLAWQDDAAWARLANNFEVLGRVLKAGGIRGLALDHEDYSGTRQFSSLDADPAFPALAELARARGRQVFGAFFRAFPDAHVLGFWLYSNWRLAYNLWNPFLDGLLDAMPPSSRLIEGNEDSGYVADATQHDCAAHALYTLQDLVACVAPENRAKYRRQASVSFGQYLDGYTYWGTNSQYHIPPLEGSRVRRLEANLADAVRFADDIVWVYGERGTFIDWKRKDDSKLRYPTWARQLPGLARSLRIAVGDGAAIEPEIASGALTNLIAQGGFDGGAIPRGVYCWKKNGKRPDAAFFRYEAQEGCAQPGAIALIGQDAAFNLGAGNLRPGETVYVRVAVKGAYPECSFNWRDEKGKAQWFVDRRILAPCRDLGKGWREVFARLVVPAKSRGITLCLTGLVAPQSPAIFDDVGIYVEKRNP